MAHDQLVTWESCSQDGCIGVRLATAVCCLAHAATRDPAAFRAEFKRIAEDGTVDARGVHLSTELLDRVLETVPHQDDRPVLNAAQFKQATFQGGRGFEGTTFLGEADFWGATFQTWIGFKQATFQGDAIFMGVRFNGEAVFDEATFQGDAAFDTATFEDYAWFGEVTFQQTAAFNWAVFERRAEFHDVRFEGYAEFSGPRFHHGADFHGAVFRRDSSFSGATFEGMADFGQAIFERVHQVGPLAATYLVLDGAVFNELVQLEVAAAVLCARRTKFPAGVRFRLRWASVVLDDADLAAPASLAGAPPFPDLREHDAARRWQRLPPGPRELRWRPRLLSLCRADVAGLRLNNVDLRACRFNGTHNLDKLRIEGEPLFARTRGWWRTRRKALAEEQQWRASRPGRWRPGGWYPRACQPPASTTAVDVHAALAPVQLAAPYRELRKGREDAKDEPGAADFYYGEMELRRHDRGAPLVERLVLWLYWLVSGYGLRGLRALVWLGAVIVALAILLQAIGFNGGDPPLRDVARPIDPGPRPSPSLRGR